MVSERNQPFYPITAQMMFDNVMEHFAKLRHIKRGKDCVSGLNGLFQDTEVMKMVSQSNQTFYPIRAQKMFESVSKQFANLRHVKQGKTSVSRLNAQFQGTKVAKMVS